MTQNVNILSFDEFSQNENEQPEELNERVEMYTLSRQSSSKSEFRQKVVAQLRKTAPSLADDEQFVENIVDTYNEEEQEAK